MDTSVLDTIGRIYKNSSGRVIGIHCISVRTYKESSPSGTIDDYPDLADRRKRTVRTSDTFQRFHLSIGSSRVIDTVQILGSYDDFELNGSSNDIRTVTYYGRDDDNLENDLIISLEDYPTIGDSF